MSNSLTRTQENTKAKQPQETKKPNPLANNVQVIDGMVVVLPRDDTPPEPTTEEIQLLIEKSKGVVTSKVEDNNFEDNNIPVPEVQNVYDTDSAEKSRIYNQLLNEQNKQRAEKAKAEIKLNKHKGSIVVNTAGNVSDDTEIFNQVEALNNN